jgi:hypothetical protein
MRVDDARELQVKATLDNSLWGAIRFGWHARGYVNGRIPRGYS